MLFFTICVRTPLSACPPSSRVSPFCHSAEPYGQGNTRLSHIKYRPLIMPLVALVQKNRAHPQLRTHIWCDAIDGSAVAIRYSVPYGTPFLGALRLAFRLRKSECLYNNATNRQSPKKSTCIECFFYCAHSFARYTNAINR